MRYNAAGYAVLAARGEDPGTSEQQRARLRKLSLEWLRAELTAWTKLVENGLPDDHVNGARPNAALATRP